MKVRLIHGIRESEGLTNMGMFKGHLAKAMPNTDVSLWQYGFINFWQSRWKNNELARDFASDVKNENDGEPEAWITHSNGAAIAYLAVEKHGAKPLMIININPALDRWRTASVLRVETIHSDNDRPVYFSQWLPFHIWGDQGKVGYKGKQHNTINHCASTFSGVMAYDGHCDMFAPQRIRQWAAFCANRIEEYSGRSA